MKCFTLALLCHLKIRFEAIIANKNDKKVPCKIVNDVRYGPWGYIYFMLYFLDKEEKTKNTSIQSVERD